MKEADTAGEKSQARKWSNLESRLNQTPQGVPECELHHKVGTAFCMPIPVSHWPGGHKGCVCVWRGLSPRQDDSNSLEGGQLCILAAKTQQLKDRNNSQVKRILLWRQESLLEAKRNFLEILSLLIGPWNLYNKSCQV